MNTQEQIEIACNPANPVNYLACCGIFDLLSRMDSAALGHWETPSPIRFTLRTVVSEADLGATIVRGLCSPQSWRFIAPTDSKEVVGVEVSFTPAASTTFSVAMDWWYETLKPDSKIDEKSSWKMWAGNQTVKQILEERLIPGCDVLRQAGKTSSLQSLLDASYPLRGRFGFDPYSSINALDLGWSPNDLGVPAPTRPFAEILASMGAASFFPSRTGRPDDFGSTRGWHQRTKREQGFHYVLWNRPIPVTLARWAALRPQHAEARGFFAARVKSRGEYANLISAKPSTIRGNTQ